jgi:hypothetical protein
MLTNHHLVFPGLLVILIMTCKSPDAGKKPLPHSGGTVYRCMFYNTENLFDPFDDPLTADEEFTPGGKMHWTFARYRAKIQNIYKVIVAAGLNQPPDIIGLCEVENASVLHALLSNTALSAFHYKMIHRNSADRRGIDVALIYNAGRVKCIHSEFLVVNKPGLFTRDILLFKGLIEKDTCFIFVNHWPSRSEGQMETEGNRIAAAKRLKQAADSILQYNRHARILIMGDFNDEPDDVSLRETLQALHPTVKPVPGCLYNLSRSPEQGKARGTLKFQGYWNLFDQIIVSDEWLSARHGLYIEPEGFRVFSMSFLLTEDNRYNGYKPFRTYNGFRYTGGFSDHLPVYVDLYDR